MRAARWLIAAGALALLLAAGVFAWGYRPSSPPDPSLRTAAMTQRLDRRDRLGTGATNVFSYLPTVVSGPLIPEDANAVMHCVGEDFNGTTLTCRKGGAWVTNGTVPSAATPPLYPNGFGASARVGLGNLFSDTNYFSLDVSDRRLDFGADFTVCIVWSAPYTGVSFVPFIEGGGGVGGWFFENETTGAIKFFTSTSGSNQTLISPVASVSLTGPNIVCAGRGGSTMYLKTNLDTLLSGTAATITPATGQNARIGRYNGAGGAFDGTIWEVYATTTTPSDALFTSIEQAAMTELGTRGEKMTFTRASAQTYTVNGVVYTAASGAPAIDAAGFKNEDAATNLVLQSRDLSQAVWTKTTMTCALTAQGADMSNTGLVHFASTCTATAGNATVLQALTTGAATRSTSLYLRRRTGSGTVNVTRDNGTTWTAVTLTSSWQRFKPATTAALSSGIANPTLGIQITTNADAVDVDYVQDEAGSFATSAIATAGTSATRARTALGFANPLAGLTTQDFCIGGHYQPADGDAWNVFTTERDLFALGDTYGAANSASIYVATGNDINFEVYDGTGASKRLHSASNWTASTTAAHQVVGCSVGGVLSIFVDGTDHSNTQPGGGTGIITTMPANIHPGTLGSNASGQVNMWGACVSKGKQAVCK